MEKGSFKSYLIYIILCLITFALIALFINGVKRNDNEIENVLNGFMPEIGEKDIVLNLKSYAVDNSLFVLYISDIENEKFDKQFKDYLTNNPSPYPIIYVDSNNLNKKIIRDLRDELSSGTTEMISEDAFLHANLFLIENGEIKSSLYENERNINIIDVDNYFKIIGGVEND